MCRLPHPGAIKLHNGIRVLVSNDNLSEKSVGFSQKMAVKGHNFCEVWIGLRNNFLFNTKMTFYFICMVYTDIHSDFSQNLMIQLLGGIYTYIDLRRFVDVVGYLSRF